jgi:hypothetical protein
MSCSLGVHSPWAEADTRATNERQPEHPQLPRIGKELPMASTRSTEEAGPPG